MGLVVEAGEGAHPSPSLTLMPCPPLPQRLSPRRQHKEEEEEVEGQQLQVQQRHPMPPLVGGRVGVPLAS